VKRVGALTGRVAVVTGASSGIGRAIALAMAADGAVLCPIGRNAERLEAVTDAARASAARVVPFRINLTDDAQVDGLVESLRGSFSGIDVLVLSAGEYARGALADSAMAQLDRLYRSNVRAQFRLVQCLLPLLKAAQGQVIFINSSAGVNAPRDVGQYAATQHAVKALADSLRLEVNESGVRVLSVFLGRVATPRQEKIYSGEGWAYQADLLLQPQDVASMVVAAASLPKTAEVTELNIRPAIKSY
jgi:NADP-dependent 3-hydroxy acid dehydrogenase YdfG